MNRLFKERQCLFKAALKILHITDVPLEIDWNSLAADKFTPNWEIHPLLWYGIEKGILPSPPEKISKRLRETYLVIGATARLHDLLLEEILHRASEKGVEICLLKGARLSREFYPDRALRPTGDIDILVKDSARKGVEEVFKEMGAVFEGSQGAHDRYIFPEAYEALLEVHFRLINIESILQRIFFPINFLDKIPWEEMINMKEGGLRLPAWFEYNYLHLHALREGYKSLKWIIDIALMEATYSEEKDPTDDRFISNARAMTHDIGLLLSGERSYPDRSGFLWKKSVRDGVMGNATRWQRLLMSMVCRMPF
jgi:hypothetical protein